MSTPKSSFKRDLFWILKSHANKGDKNPVNLCRDVANRGFSE
jgi:hypothetical protein